MATVPTFVSAPASSDSGSGSISPVSIGAAFTGRVVVFSLRVSGVVPTTATIGGVIASIASDSSFFITTIAAVVPTGTTTSLVTNGSSFDLDTVYTFPAGTSTIPSSIASGSAGGSTASMTLSPKSGDGIVAFALDFTGATPNFTVGGLTTDGTFTDSFFNVGKTASAGGVAGGSHPVTATGTTVAVGGATFGPTDPTTPQVEAVSGGYTFAQTGTLLLEAWGVGASGGRVSRGSGGGAYSKSTSVAVTAGQTLFWNVPAAPAGVSTGTGTTPASKTWLNLGANSAPTLSTTGAQADFGVGGTFGAIGTGGLVANCVGSTSFAGGNGGVSSNNGGGGGGAGSGGAGGNASGLTGGSAGAIDGGAGGAGATLADGGDGSSLGGGGGATANSTSGNGGAGGPGQVRWTFTPTPPISLLGPGSPVRRTYLRR